MDKPKVGTRLRLKKDHSRCGTFVRERVFGALRLWTVKVDTKPGEGSGYWVYAPDEWELEPTVRVKP